MAKEKEKTSKEEKAPKKEVVKEKQAPKKEAKPKAKKKKKKKPKLSLTQRYFKTLKWISFVWLGAGLILALMYEFKDHPSFPDKLEYTMFSDFKKR